MITIGGEKMRKKQVTRKSERPVSEKEMWKGVPMVEYAEIRKVSKVEGE